MKTLNLLFVFFIVSNPVFAQFAIDAGKDIVLCTPYNNIRLGGNPSASGGHDPYSFEWKCKFFAHGRWLSSTDFLDNSTSPNPFLQQLNEPVNGTITFILKVTDAEQISMLDSVKVTISSISFMHLASPGSTISLGDSVQLEVVNIYNGIPPFSYLWNPVTGLSSPFLKNPYAKPDFTTCFTVKVTDSIGCINFDLYSVTILMTEVESVKLLHNSQVFPNPIDNNSIISINEFNYDNFTLKVFDLNGKLLLSDRFYNCYRIGEKGLGNGVYIYVIFNNKTVYSFGKIIIK